MPRQINDMIKDCREDILDATEYLGNYSNVIFPNELRQVKMRLTNNTLINPGNKIIIEPCCTFVEILDQPQEILYDPEFKLNVVFAYIKNHSKDTTFILKNDTRIGKIVKVYDKSRGSNVKDEDDDEYYNWC